MFGNPVVASGYPIATKPRRGLGIEIPLNIMAALTGSERVDEFDDKVFIEGFSTMLVATEAAKDLLLWHYLFNQDGERISYFGHSTEVSSGISSSQVATARHVVGWCADCRTYAGGWQRSITYLTAWEFLIIRVYYLGASDVRYDLIRESNLPEPHATCMLEGASISGGKYVTGGVTFAIGVKDRPPHLTRHSYIPKLMWIETQHVVLWGEGDHRGWLVNGTSALLHLTRASLQHYSTGDFRKALGFRPGDMTTVADEEAHRPEAASEILADDHNRDPARGLGWHERALGRG